MALSANMMLNVRTDGNDTNGGGFVLDATGSNFSLQASPQGSGTNLTVDASVNTDVLPDGYVPSAADIGNVVNIISGAGFTARRYTIISIQSGKWRLDASPAATSTAGGVWRMGGALATLGGSGAAQALEAGGGRTTWVKTGTYTQTTNTPNVAGGPIGWVSPWAVNNIVRGYNTVFGDLTPFSPLRPVIIAGAPSIAVGFIISANVALIADLIIDGNRGVHASTTSGAIAASQLCTVMNVLARNCSSVGIGGNSVDASYCQAVNNTSHGLNCRTAYRSVATNNGGSGYFGINGQAGTLTDCVLAYNTSVGASMAIGGASGIIERSVFAYNGSNGITLGSRNHPVLNSVIWGNGGWGVNGTAGYLSYSGPAYQSVALGNNTSGGIQIIAATQTGIVTLSADPFVDAVNGDFRLNSLSGGGALLKGAGFAAFPAFSSYENIGVWQDATAGGGGGGSASARVVGG